MPGPDDVLVLDRHYPAAWLVAHFVERGVRCCIRRDKVNGWSAIAPQWPVRVLATNLDARSFPCEVFVDLYHQRWRIEEAFKRLKHRARLECVFSLTQHALLVDMAAKVLADNLSSLVCQVASEEADLPGRQRVCNRAYAAPLLQRLLPRMVPRLGCVFALLHKALNLLGGNTHRRVKDRSRPCPARHVKPHPHLAYKG